MCRRTAAPGVRSSCTCAREPRRTLSASSGRRAFAARGLGQDLAPDGKRLAALVAEDAKDEKPLTHLTFLLNFSDELRRKAPMGK